MSEYLDGFGELPEIDRKRELDGEWIDDCVSYGQEDWDRDMAYFREREQGRTDSMKQAIDTYMQPAAKVMEQKRAKSIDWLLPENRTEDEQQALLHWLEATTHTESREVTPGVWEHTFTPVDMTMSDVAELFERLHLPAPAQRRLNIIPIVLYESRASRRRKRERRQHRAAFRRRKRGLV